MEKVIILGNHGSGKRELAWKLSDSLELDVIHLDELIWESGEYQRKRPEVIIAAEIAILAQEKTWIAEGVDGDLAQQFLPMADFLIWLDLGWASCIASLRASYAEDYKQHGQTETDERFTEMLKWASGYWQRIGPSSYKGHQHLFGEFKGKKIRLASMRAVENFLDTIPQRVFG
jgi:adenylate kinase family enzyme